MRSRVLSLVLLPAFAMLAPLAAQEPSKTLPEDVRKKFNELRIATTKLNQEVYSGYATAKTPEQREAFMIKSMKEFHAKGAPFARQAIKLIEPHAKSEGAIDVFTWLLTFHTNTEAGNKAAQLLMQHHITHEKTQQIASRFMYAPMSWTEPMLRKMIASDIPTKRKGLAYFQLATCCKTRVELPNTLKTLGPRMLEAMELRFGEKYLKSLATGDSAALEKDAIRLYRQVAKTYGEIKYGTKTLADHAKSAIYEMENLSIGKVAPEIEGHDIDGKPMKLSEFRGKVVMLDFWGHW